MAGPLKNARSIGDRVLMVAFGLSLAVHLGLLVGQLLSLDWLRRPRQSTPMDVIYDKEIAQQELRSLQEQLARAARETAALPETANIADRTQIRIPDRPSLLSSQSLFESLPGRSSIVDLTNLVDASRGDPVLLSYFSAIREQIQQTANRQAWLAGAMHEGLVYVSFMLASTGAVQDVVIVEDRSVRASVLQDAAVRIVKAAAPFPPFPPSMVEPNKTIVVPLEFLLGL